MSPAVPAFRSARPEELDAITALAIRSKRHWGYPDAFIEALRPELTFRPADLDDEGTRVEVLVGGDRLIGVLRMRRRTELA